MPQGVYSIWKGGCDRGVRRLGEERTRWYATRAANYGLEWVIDTGWSRRVRLSTECQGAYLPLPANAKGSRPTELSDGV